MNNQAISIHHFKLYIEDYLLLRLRLNHQPSSVNAARKDLRLFLSYCNDNKVTHVQGAAVIDFMNWLGESRSNGPAAINRKRASLYGYIRHLVLRQVPGAKEFPIDFIPRARHHYHGPATTLEPDEVEQLLISIDRSSVIGYRDFTLYSLLYCIGLRLGEALAIDIKDIDFDKQTILIHGKGKRQRTLPLTVDLIRLFKQWIKHRKNIYMSEKSDALFLSKKGNRLSLRTAEENFQKLVADHKPFGIDHVVPHTLRHSFASHALENEKDLLIIKTILGHVLMRSTEIYLHPSMDQLRKSGDNHRGTELVRKIRSKRVWLRGVQSGGKR